MIGSEAAQLLLWEHDQRNFVIVDPNAKWNRYNSRSGIIILTERTFYGNDDVSKSLALHEAAHAVLHKGFVFSVLKAEFEANVFALRWIKNNPVCDYKKARRVLWTGFLFYLVPRLILLFILLNWLL